MRCSDHNFLPLPGHGPVRHGAGVAIGWWAGRSAWGAAVRHLVAQRSVET